MKIVREDNIRGVAYWVRHWGHWYWVLDGGQWADAVPKKIIDLDMEPKDAPTT